MPPSGLKATEFTCPGPPPASLTVCTIDADTWPPPALVGTTLARLDGLAEDEETWLTLAVDPDRGLAADVPTARAVPEEAVPL
jgi:hypothetical protein